MRLLFVHEVNWRRKVTFEMHDFPELLSLSGHQITFVDYAEGEPRTGFARIFDARTRHYPSASRAHSGSSVDVITPGLGFPPPLERPTASLTQVPLLRRELKSRKYDAVVLYGVPTNGWQTVALARRYGVPVMYRAIDLPNVLRQTRFGPAIERAERYIVRHADAISANNEELAKHCVDLGAAQAAVSVDYPGVDLDRFSPGPPPDELRKRYGLLPCDRVVLFMGTLYRFSGLDWFLEHVSPYLHDDPRLRIVLVGDGEAEKALKVQVSQLGIDGSVIFTGRVEYPELAQHLRLGDVAVITFEPEPVTHHALPVKILQYLGCGLPTISTPLRGLQGMLPEGDGIGYRELGAPFVEAVIELLGDDDLRAHLGARSRAVMEERCEWSVALSAFVASVKRAISRHKTI